MLQEVQPQIAGTAPIIAQLRKVHKAHPYVAMVLLALALRITLAGFLYSEHLNPDRDYFRFAGEAGRIARSIVEGHGFSSPFFSNTGPTALMAPAYCYLLAGSFKLFGVYSKGAAWFMLLLNCLFSALTCIPIFLIARKNFGDAIAGCAGWTWALFPYAVYFSADFLWPTVLSTLLLSVLFLLALYMQDSNRVGVWVSFGLVSGFAALNEPIVMAVLPALGLWVCFSRYKNKIRSVRFATLTSLAFLAVVAPWFVRNYRTFHQFIPFRGGLGLELYVGNNGSTWHWAAPGFHPTSSEAEWQEYQNSGELKYVAHKQQQAMQFIGDHPGQFASLCLRRAVYFWTGYWSFDHRYLAEEPDDPANMLLSTVMTVFTLIGLWRAYRRGAPFAPGYAIVLLLFPITYYFTHPQDYYRRLIDPLMVVLAVYAVVPALATKKVSAIEDSISVDDLLPAEG